MEHVAQSSPSMRSMGGQPAGTTAPASSRLTARRWRGGIVIALLLATAWLYAPVREFGFVAFDDPEYFTANERVQGGLSWGSIAWAFTTTHFSYWHPLTWLSYLVDVELFGPGPQAPHLVNVAFHALNVALLWALLQRLTRSTWRSALVAALFAVHPLHVESVAWVAERKDVLSAFFFLLTLHAWVGRVAVVTAARSEAVGLGRRLFPAPGALVLFACALMSKPTVVTLPFVLLLLDVWPLRRWSSFGWRICVLEKLPFLLLSAAASVFTVLAQSANGALQTAAAFSWTGRIENAVVAYARYLEKTVWPVDLAFFYPHPGNWPLPTVLLSLAVVAGLTVLAALLRRTVPVVLVGWLIFLGMLVPTIGLVQSGGQALADRYTYLPHIGLFLALVWGICAWLGRARTGRVILSVVSIAVLLGMGWRTREQLPVWRSSESLFTHAISAAPGNPVAHTNLGNVYYADGRFEQAIAQYRLALAVNAADVHALHNLATALGRTGRTMEAIEVGQRVVGLAPDLAAARAALCRVLFQAGRAGEAVTHLRHLLVADAGNAQARADLGYALLQQGDFAAATAELQAARQAGVSDVTLHASLGRALLRLGQRQEAIRSLRQAIAAEPRHGDANYDLALALFQEGELAEAVPHFSIVAELQPQSAEVANNLGWTLLLLGRLDEAARRFEAALRADPGAAIAYTNLASTLIQLGRPREAIARYEALLSRDPDHPQALGDLAWLLATSADATVRDGKRAVALARRAYALTSGNDPLIGRALAAALAEQAEFAAALTHARAALETAVARGDDALADAVRAQVQAYSEGRAHREPAPGPSASHPAQSTAVPPHSATGQRASLADEQALSPTLSPIFPTFPHRSA